MREMMDFIKRLKHFFSSKVAAVDEEPELKVLALLEIASKNVEKIYSLRHKKNKKMLCFPTRKKAINAGICCGEAAEVLQGAQALTGEVQRMSELTCQLMNSALKKQNTVGIVPGTKKHKVFQAIKMMNTELEGALSVLKRLGKNIDESQNPNDDPMRKYWYLSRYGMFVSPDDFQSLLRRLADMINNVKRLIKLIAQSAAMEN